MSRTLTVDIPRDYWLSANRPVVNHGYRRRLIDAIHNITITAARAQKLEPIDGRFLVAWEIQYPKGVRTDKGDATNSHPTCKAILDALVPRWLPDDGPRYVIEERYRRGPNLDQPGGHRVILRLIDQEVPFGYDRPVQGAH